MVRWSHCAPDSSSDMRRGVGSKGDGRAGGGDSFLSSVWGGVERVSSPIVLLLLGEGGSHVRASSGPPRDNTCVFGKCGV